jgi:hypothetical protein
MVWLWILGGLWLAWGVTALCLRVGCFLFGKPDMLSWWGWWQMLRWDLLGWRWWVDVMVVLPVVLVTVGLIRVCGWLGVSAGDLVGEE